MKPTLFIVVPCYNEQSVLPISAPLFLEKISQLVASDKISSDSKVLFVDDGSRDNTWQIITDLAKKETRVKGISLSRNFGHQSALLAGLFEASRECDITISIDCDGQDDINAMDRMIEEYLGGAEIVYGVRSARGTDTPFKRGTARAFYKLLNLLGAEVVYDHADYRLLSSRAIEALKGFKEVNVFLRGMVPMLGFKSTCVEYERRERMAGKGHYPLKRMVKLALDGITSLSIRPIRIITVFGLLVSFISLVGIIWSFVSALLGNTISGWASTVCIICFLGGVQMLSLGIIGEYIGKIYLETKERPRYIIEKQTESE